MLSYEGMERTHGQLPELPLRIEPADRNCGCNFCWQIGSPKFWDRKNATHSQNTPNTTLRSVKTGKKRKTHNKETVNFPRRKTRHRHEVAGAFFFALYVQISQGSCIEPKAKSLSIHDFAELLAGSLRENSSQKTTDAVFWNRRTCNLKCCVKWMKTWQATIEVQHYGMVCQTIWYWCIARLNLRILYLSRNLGQIFISIHPSQNSALKFILPSPSLSMRPRTFFTYLNLIPTWHQL